MALQPLRLRAQGGHRRRRAWRGRVPAEAPSLAGVNMSTDRLQRYLDCIAACNACAVSCQHCASLCLQEPDVKMMVRCIALDFDCAEICSVSVALMAGGSELADAMCG